MKKGFQYTYHDILEQNVCPLEAEIARFPIGSRLNFVNLNRLLPVDVILSLRTSEQSSLRLS